MSRLRGSHLIAASLGVHVVLGVALGHVEPRARPERPTVVTLVDVPPPPPPAEPPTPEPPPPEPPPEPPRAAPAPRAPKIASAAPPPESPPSAPPSTPDAPLALGLTLSNSAGPGGTAVAAGDPNGVRGGVRSTRVAAKKALTPPTTSPSACDGETTKPRPLHMPKPRYTDLARAQGLEGRVRVEISLDATGAVTEARVVTSLGAGLDEAALDAARGARFAPAVTCGVPVAATFVLAVRFTR